MGDAYSPNQASAVESAQRPPAPQARVFVGIRIAPAIADQLARFAAALQSPFVRTVAPVDIHLTLAPPWNETLVSDAIAKLARATAPFSAFPLVIQRVCYGPQPRWPRLLWAECAAGKELFTLRAALLEAFGQANERPFQPHVTLARIRGNSRALARKYPIDERLSLTQRVESIELFQSPPPRATGYRILASSRLAEAVGSGPTA
jgi:2'-5' RNA ligase